jgi:periplasmic protein CpxP/Spy
MKMSMLRNTMVRTAMLGLCVAALGTVPMVAQDNAGAAMQQGQGGGRNGAEMQQRQLDMMTKNLNLTPDQVTQVKAIQDDTAKQSEAVRNDSTITDKRSKMMDIRKASQDKIRGVLTDDQKTKYDAMMAQMQQRRQQGGGGAAPQL